MTREQKLALIVGFSLVLLVGVLISDHLSGVRRQAIDEVAEREVTPTRETGREELPPAQWNPGLAEADRAEGAPGADRTGQPPTILAGESEWGGTARPQEGERRSASSTSTDGAGPLIEITQSTDLSPSGGGSSGSASLGWLGGLGSGALHLELPRPAVALDRPGLDVATPAGGEASGGRRTEPGRGEGRKGKSVRHVVKRGESLYAIAERYYGKGALWRRIAEANAGLVGEDGAFVRAGVRLVIPGVEPKRAEPSPAGRDDRATAQTVRRYTVRKGDTLSEISQRLLGTARRWREIMELNGIEEEERISVGMVLRIPDA